MNANDITREQIIANILAAIKTRNVTATHNGKTGWEERVLLLGQYVRIDIRRKRTPGSSQWRPDHSGGWYVDIDGESKGRFHWSAKREHGFDYTAIADGLIYCAERKTRQQAASNIRSTNIDAINAHFPQERGYGFKLPGGTTIDPTSRTGRFDVSRTVRVEGLTLDEAAAFDAALADLLKQFQKGDVA